MKETEIEDRNKLMRKIYKNLRTTYNADEAIRRLRERHDFGHLSVDYIRRIVWTDDKL